MTDAEFNSIELKYLTFIYLHIFGEAHVNIDTYTINFCNTFIRQLVGNLYTLLIHRTTDNWARFLCHKVSIRVHQYNNL